MLVSVRIQSVAIVGRPNVGKSTLFNCLLGRRVAIVERFPGVTRDRITSIVQEGELFFELTDTGGIGLSGDEIAQKVTEQIETAIKEADLLIFVTDVREGLVPLDEMAALKLRKTSKPIIVVANKADTRDLEMQAAQFHKLALGEVLPMSAIEGRGREELLGKILGKVSARQSPPAPQMKIAIVGRRNVGKSTFVNALARKERVIVTPKPGTTRDAIEVPFYKGTKLFVAVDTAGIRKKWKLEDSVEFFARCRAEAAIRRSDITLLLLEATQTISRVDKKLAQFVLSEGKPCVIVVNKWDLASGVETQEFARYVRACLPGLSFAPIIFTSALKKTHVFDAVELARSLFEQGKHRVPTAKLNRIVQEALCRRSPGTRKGALPKIFYATQAETGAPTIVLFVNNASLFSPSYLRYLENFFRNNLPFSEIPIRLKLRSRERKA
jgi:GTP-binding protein